LKYIFLRGTLIPDDRYWDMDVVIGCPTSSILKIGIQGIPNILPIIPCRLQLNSIELELESISVEFSTLLMMSQKNGCETIFQPE
jgi:hypothetical protein